MPLRAGLAAIWAGAALSAVTSKLGISCAHSPAHSSTFCADLAESVARGAAWSYSWALSPANTSCAALSSAPFEPQVWGSAAARNATPAAVPLSTHMLGFNEPNSAGQSNLTPAAAAKLWPAVEAAAAARNLSLVAPVPSGSDTQWLREFFTACGGCAGRVRAVALHPYACDAAALRASLDAWAAFGKPLWVTEFNCGNGMRNASAAEHLAWMRVALPLLQADARVERFAWMSARDDKVPGAALFAGAGGQLTPLGREYFAAAARSAGEDVSAGR